MVHSIKKPVIIDIWNGKGGTAKTTTTYNLAVAMSSEHGKKVLCIDMDGQAGLTRAMGFDPNKFEDKYIGRVLIDTDKDDGEKRVKMADIIITKEIKNKEKISCTIDLAPSKEALYMDEMIINNYNLRESRLKWALDEFEGLSKYDYVLIDCSPNPGQAVNNALMAGDRVIIPVTAEAMALAGLPTTLNGFAKVRKSLNPSIKTLGILCLRYDKRRNLSKEIKDMLSVGFKEIVFDTLIPENVSVAEAPSHGMSVIEYKQYSDGAIAYKSFCNEVLKRMEV